MAADESYRALSISPDGAYAVIQSVRCRPGMLRGNANIAADMTAAFYLARMQGTTGQIVGREKYCPFDLEDGPCLDRVEWHPGFAKLCFTAIEQVEERRVRMRFDADGSGAVVKIE